MDNMFWIVCLLILGFLLNACNIKDRKTKFPELKLPADHEEYEFIDNSVIRFGNHEMTFLFDSFDPIRHFVTKNNNLIVMTNEKKEPMDSNHMIYRILKFDSLGNEIDQYNSEEKEKLFEGYLINLSQNYYVTWPLDGDTSKKYIIKQNENFNWDEEEGNYFFNKIKKGKTIYFTEYISEVDEGEYISFNKIYYLRSNKWYVLYLKTSPMYNIEGSMPKDKPYSVFNCYYGSDENWFTNNYENIQCVYFDKIKLEQYYSYNGGGWGNAVKINYWRGNLYTHLVVDEDTLKFKDELMIDESFNSNGIIINNKCIGMPIRSDKNSFTPFLYYSNPVLEYKLFTNDDRKLYIIKNVNTSIHKVSERSTDD